MIKGILIMLSIEAIVVQETISSGATRRGGLVSLLLLLFLLLLLALTGALTTGTGRGLLWFRGAVVRWVPIGRVIADGVRARCG